MQEALNVTVGQIDFSLGCVVIETLKQRTKGVFREIPLPDAYLDDLKLVYDLKTLQGKGNKKQLQQPIWSMSARTAQRRINEAMQKAGINGLQACAKGIRHGFAIYAIVEKAIPIMGSTGFIDLSADSI